MAVTSDLIAFGSLTGSGTQDTVHTSGGVEYVTVTFRNYDSTDRTLSAWINSVSSPNYVLKDAPLASGESIVIELKMGSGDLIKAESSAGSAISAIVEVDALS